MAILHVGIDLAKNAFAVHGADSGNDRQRSRVQPRLTALGLARPRARPVELRGQGPARSHHEGRRRQLALLAVFGAQAVLNAARQKTDGVSRWAVALEGQRGYWRTVVAIAAKNARMAWAVLRRGEEFALPA